MLFVTVQVLLPCIKIDSTSAWKTLSFSDLGNLEVQMPLSLWPAIQACAFRALTSFSHVMSPVSQLPRYLNSMTFVSGAQLQTLSPSSSAKWWNTMYSIFVSFKCRLISAASFSSLSTSSCACAISSEISAMSSTKSRSLMTTVMYIIYKNKKPSRTTTTRPFVTSQLPTSPLHSLAFQVLPNFPYFNPP